MALVCYPLHTPPGPLPPSAAVCISFLNKFSQRLRDRDIDMSSQDAIEMELMRTCSEATGRDERFVSSDYFNATVLL